MIAELLHNLPTQRILLITHSNHALNDLFEKVMERDVDERYLLRLGRGSDDLEVQGRDFSKFGRVQYMLARRMQLLTVVERMAASIGVAGDVAYTCETAAHFFLHHVLARWQKFVKLCRDAQEVRDRRQAEGSLTADEAARYEATPATHFPFTAFFTSPTSPLFSSTFAADMNVALSCFSYLQSTFTELEECRPFELLRSYRDRSSYLITHHARIIAMTCTHAAIKRHSFIAQRLQYDTLVMEESAQVLEVETFIPLLLQLNNPESGSRLKRVVLLGDHHQLPPVVKNRAFQHFAHLDQSLFTRLIRLGTPHVELNAQGRSRPSLAALWNWRYDQLLNLPVTTHSPAYLQANPGLLLEYQLINVEDYQGQGESTPSPFYYQNLGEAEYIVAFYQYLRLMGYPASRVSVITTYNGQKALIKDVMQQRCARHPLFGVCKVSTVDQFQGQQNDFILLSMVRTRHAGHIRDVRRLVVAMSRARLGLYVFARAALYGNCFELTRCLGQMLSRPTRLQVVERERCSIDSGLWCQRRVEEVEGVQGVEEVVDVVDMGARVVRLTREVQGEVVEYRRRVEAYQREVQEAEARRQREEEERREAKERLMEEEMRARRAEDRITAHARETERLERELLQEDEGGEGEAPLLLPVGMPTIDEDDDDDVL